MWILNILRAHESEFSKLEFIIHSNEVAPRFLPLLRLSRSSRYSLGPCHTGAFVLPWNCYLLNSANIYAGFSLSIAIAYLSILDHFHAGICGEKRNLSIDNQRGFGDVWIWVKKVKEIHFSEKVNPLPVKPIRSDHGSFAGQMAVHQRDMCLPRSKRWHGVSLDKIPRYAHPQDGAVVEIQNQWDRWVGQGWWSNT